MKKKSWMTKTGSILSALAGNLVAAAQVCPNPEWVPWLIFAAAILGSTGIPLIGLGIRRRLPATATRKPRTKPVTE